jgi:hypothetical protein
MTRLGRKELEDMREEGLSQALRQDFAAAEQAAAAWEQTRPPLGLSAVLDLIDELRSVFGDPEVDRRPWVGTDFRL